VGLRYGQAETVDPTLATCLGRPATAIADMIRYTVAEHPQLWRTTAPTTATATSTAA
jgi:hypothetical protein